jgi:D-glycero-D-manno-heptose 1,7-bisphosphate phosphatase
MPGKPDAVLLDRDGTINVKAPEGSYITRSEQVELLPGAAQAIRELNRAAVPVAIVTNQRGIALGRMSEADLAEVHARLAVLLIAEGAAVDRIFYCPHEKGTCGCRKPGTLLLRRAQRAFRLPTLSNTLMIGDSQSDMLAGERVGARTVMLSSGPRPQGHGPAVASSLLEAVRTALSPGSDAGERYR